MLLPVLYTPHSFETSAEFAFCKYFLHPSFQAFQTRLSSYCQPGIIEHSAKYRSRIHPRFSSVFRNVFFSVFAGIWSPCILFPSAITNAVSSMLLPTVAEIQEMKEKRRLQAIISKIACSCIFLGCFCCIFLLISGKWIGIFLFKSPLAGSFILTLSWICPFLYTNTVLLGMINGLGKTTFSFIINFLSLCIRIAGVCLFIPIWGINGYLTGLLISQIFLFLCCILRLVIYIKNFS